MFTESCCASPARSLRDEFIGLDSLVPLLDGSRGRCVNLDNAATTPPLRVVSEAVARFLPWYSSVHRGSGYKSQMSSEIYDECRRVVGDFFGADPDRHSVIFCANTTEAINKLSCRMPASEGHAVLATVMEHHSNMLPWRLGGTVDYVGIRSGDGSLDLQGLEQRLKDGRGRIPLVAVTGASNVTGCMPPLGRIARLAHAHGAKLLVDGAQLAPHRAVHMGPCGGEESIDFLVFSAHKMYAPFGSGALVGPREFFVDGRPSMAGGGAVKMVTLQEILWAEPPEVEEAGTPNVVGAVALAAAIRFLQGIGMEVVAERERNLTRHLLRRLSRLDGIRMYGETEMREGCDRGAVVPILAEKYPHGLLAAILSHEYGIAVRHGCFCAHPYLLSLLGLSAEEIARSQEEVRRGNKRSVPGMVRISMALYNTIEEIDFFVDSLEQVLVESPRGNYVQDGNGEYAPENWPLEMAGEFGVFSDIFSPRSHGGLEEL